MARDSALLQLPWVRIVPHLIDTLLLASALLMAITTGQYPFAQAWLTAKLLALIAYIALGTVALKRGKTKRIRVGAFIAALLAFTYIGAVALTKNVLVFI